jgi:hypothetical protein
VVGPLWIDHREIGQIVPGKFLILKIPEGDHSFGGPNVRDLGSLFCSKEQLEITARQQVAVAFDIPLENVPDSGDE